MPAERYVVIGFGVYGVSAALHLLKAKLEHPVQLIIVSHRQPQEPSDDISKIIRIDYASAKRMEEAIRAQECWKKDERFKSFYQPFGRIVAYDEKNLQTLDDIDNARAELKKEKRKRLGKNVLKQFYGSTNAPDGLTFVYNEDDGLVEWEGCMQAIRETVQNLSRENKQSTILEIPLERLIHKERRITAVKLANNEWIETEDMKVILTAGPWISEILQRSEIEQPPGPRSPVATGIFAFTLQLREDQAELFRGKPGFSHIGYAEFLPPTKDDGIAKITCIEPFTNVQSGSSLSCPKDVSDSYLAIQTMLGMTRWAREYLPKLRGAKITSIKSYWDGMTQTQNPLISRHPHYENLVLGGGGSYTRAKDLPTVGENILKVLHGESPNPHYGWDNVQPSHHDQPSLLAKGNFENLERQAAGNREVQDWILKRKSQTVLTYLEEI